MDLIRLFTGGEIEITTDEIHHMSVQQRLAFFALAIGLTDTTDCILSGVNATIQTNVSVTVEAGWVILDGELLQVDAAVIPKDGGVVGNNWRFEKVSSDGSSPEWDRNYRDNSTHNILQVNRAVPVNVTSIVGGDLDVVNGLSLLQIIRVQSDWNETDSTNPAFILNKPTPIFALASGRIEVGDIGGSLAGVTFTTHGDFTNATVTLNQNAGQDNLYTITMPDVGTTDYEVIINVVGKNVQASFSEDNDVLTSTRAHTATSFQIMTRDLGGGTQNVDLICTLIPYNNA